MICAFGVFDGVPCNECVHLGMGLKEIVCIKCGYIALECLEILRLRGVEDLGCTVLFR